MQRRYTVLRVISFLFKLGAVILFLLALASLGFTVFRLASALRGKMGLAEWAQVGGAFVLFLWGMGEFMVLYATGEALNVLMAVEENTRATSLRLVRLLSLLSDQVSGQGEAGESTSSPTPSEGEAQAEPSPSSTT